MRGVTLEFEHADLGIVIVSPMHAGEFAYVIDGWMRSSHWKRSAIVDVIEHGAVLVARDENGLGLGWLAMRDGKIAHCVVKSGFRSNGLCRALWQAAGKPATLADDVVRRAPRVLARLLEGT